eukprot:scaffold6698_cov76-Amphora_coffeaeformis.AAC.1
MPGAVFTSTKNLGTWLVAVVNDSLVMIKNSTCIYPIHNHCRRLSTEAHDARAKSTLRTGCPGVDYGTGSRIELYFAGLIIVGALNGELNKVNYVTNPFFGLEIPKFCPNVPDVILNPRHT